jgi:hypothetical protein
MFIQTLNQTAKCGDFFCTILCTNRAQLSPNTVISPTERDPILLKTRTPQNANRVCNQGVAGSNPVTSTNIFRPPESMPAHRLIQLAFFFYREGARLAFL